MTIHVLGKLKCFACEVGVGGGDSGKNVNNIGCQQSLNIKLQEGVEINPKDRKKL